MCVLVPRPVHESSISLSFAKLMNYSNVKGSVKRDGEIKRRPRQTDDGERDGGREGGRGDEQKRLVTRAARATKRANNKNESSKEIHKRFCSCNASLYESRLDDEQAKCALACERVCVCVCPECVCVFARFYKIQKAIYKRQRERRYACTHIETQTNTKHTQTRSQGPEPRYGPRARVAALSATKGRR